MHASLLVPARSAAYQLGFGPSSGHATAPYRRHATVSGGGSHTNVTGVFS